MFVGGCSIQALRRLLAPRRRSTFHDSEPPLRARALAVTAGQFGVTKVGIRRSERCAA